VKRIIFYQIMSADMQAAARNFFKSPHFAVVGASQDRSKFGFRSKFLSDVLFSLVLLSSGRNYYLNALEGVRLLEVY
jgi:hypothetical protein